MTTLRRRASTKPITLSAYRQAIERMSAELGVLIRSSPHYKATLGRNTSPSVREHWRMTVNYLNRLYGIERLEPDNREALSEGDP